MAQESPNDVQKSTQQAYHPVTFGIPVRTTGANNASHSTSRCLPGQAEPVYNGPDRRVQMILPQVHLRKPCYDFSFL